ALPDPDNPVGEINILPVQRQGLSHPHSSQIKEQEHCSLHHAAQGPQSSRGKAETRLEKPPPFVTREDTRYKWLQTDTQKASGWDERPWFLQGDEAAELADETQALCIPPCEPYIGPDNAIGNDRIARRQVGRHEPVQDHQPSFHIVAITGGTLELKESPDL